MRNASLLSLVALLGCGNGHQPATVDAAGDASADAVAAPSCTSERTLLSNWISYVPPDAGPISVGVPYVVISGSDVYYTVDPSSNLTGAIMRVSMAGGAVTKIAESPHPDRLVITGSTVIFTDTSGQVFAVDRGGGTPVALAPTDGAPADLASDGDNVYFSDIGGLKRVPVAGGALVTLTTDFAYSFGLVGSDVILATKNAIERVPAAGGAVTPLAAGVDAPYYPVGCGSDLCWLTAGTLLPDGSAYGAAFQLTPGGSPAVLVTNNALYHPHAVVADGGRLVIASDGYGISRIDLATGALTSVFGAAGPNGLATAGDCVVWAELSGIYSIQN